MKFEGLELLIIFSTIIVSLVVTMMILIYIFFIRKKTQLLLKQQEKELMFSKELALSQIEMKEQTLSYVGQELHDDLGQKLSVARLMSNKLSTQLVDEKKESIAEISNLIGECISDLRNLAKNFITDQIEHFGLIDSIEREVKRIDRLDFVKVQFFFNNHDIDMNSKHAVILFRIVQECINNSLKHSKAKKMFISVDDNSDSIEIKIQDNGVGIVENSNDFGSGFKNMKNRAELINAKFLMNSELNKGTEIKIKYQKKLNP